MSMKFEESDIWDDPLVRDIRKVVDVDLDQLNKLSSAKVMIETDTLDPMTAAVLIAATGKVKGELPKRVKDAVELLESSSRLYKDGPAYLFKAEDTAVLKITMATLSGETTGEGFKYTKAKAAGRASDVQKGVDLMAEIADQLVESGAHLAIEPKLVEKFAEGLDNLKELEPFSSRRRMLNEAAASLKYAMMQGNAADATHHAPRVDPDSRYIRLKNDAKTRFKLT